MAGTTMATKTEVIDRLFAAITGGNVEAARSIYAPDAKIWHNFDNIEQAPEQNLQTLGWLSRSVKNLRYEDVTRTEMADGRVFQQHTMRGTSQSGNDFELFACIVFTLDGDHITRLEEYLDTAQAAALRG